MKNCPMCGENAEDTAARCSKCDYQFGSTSAPADSAVAEGASGLIPIGWVMLIIGVVVYGLSWMMSISVAPSPYAIERPLEVVNIGLLAKREAVQLAGMLLFITGCVLISAGYIVTAINRLRP